MSVNMASTIVPKSDQLNAMDLTGGPMVITITAVRKVDNPQQPIIINYDGDRGKPYKPNLGMRRALVFLWGLEGEDYVGRSLELFIANEVTWAGEEVGGIRISRASHIQGDVTFPLQLSQKKRTLYTVKALPMRQQQQQQQRPKLTLAEHVERYVSAIMAAETLEAMAEVQRSESAEKVRAAVSKSGDAALLDRMTAAGAARYAELSGPDDDDDDNELPEMEDDLPGDDE